MNISNIPVSKLNPAKYNPRKISREQLESLKKSYAEFGDLGGIVKNRRSGNLISGHQRCKVIPPDAEITITQTYDPPSRTGTVAEGYILIEGEKYSYREVDWDDAKEKLGNLAANNQGGENDEDMLQSLLADLENLDIDLSLSGIDLFFGDDQGELEEVTEEIRPYRMTHVLLSFPPEKLMDIAPLLEKIYAIEGVEHEQASNG